MTTMSRMRIAHVVSTFPPYQAGTGNVCYYNAREIVRRGHEVHVFTTAFSDVVLRETIDGIYVRRLRSLIRIGNASILINLPFLLSQFDVVHLHCPNIVGAELTVLGAKLHRCPLVVTYHSDLILYGTWRDILFRVATETSRVILKQADRVIFVSDGHARQSDQKDIYWRYPEKCSVIPNGIDTDFFRPGIDRPEIRKKLGLPSKAKIVGFVASLDAAHHYKGLDLILKALSTDVLDRAYLLIVGDGDRRSAFEQQTTLLGIADRVQFYGYADHHELPPLYRCFDVTVVPSTVPESFSLVIAESLSCAIPVIASDGPGVRSTYQERGTVNLFTPGNIDELIGALVRIFSLSDEQRRSLGMQGRKYVEQKYSWTRIGSALETLYLSLRAESR